MKVSIIGAGTAGLGCARKLEEFGIEAIIYEARNRIGGRLHAEMLENGTAVDMGAFQIHGGQKKADGTPSSISLLLEEASASFYRPKRGPQYYDRFGKLLSAEESKDMLALIDPVFDQAFLASGNDTSIDPDKSFKDYIDETTEKVTPEEKAEKAQIQNFGGRWSMVAGCSIDKQSLKYLWFEEEEAGEEAWIQSGYARILTILSKGLDIRLDWQVEGITSSRSGVQLKSNKGDVVESDLVVVTIPLGCLKRNMISFDPPLSKPVSQAIAVIGYGRIGILVATYKKAWWTVSPNFVHFFQPFSEDGQIYPAINIRSFAHLDAPYNKPILKFELSQDVLALLEGKSADAAFAWLSPYIKRLPGYTSNVRPQTVFQAGWHDDPLAGHGTWSHSPAGSDHLIEHIDALRQGMPESKFLFAGEAIPVPFTREAGSSAGTVAGALRSGEYAAEVIRDMLM